MEKAVQKDNRRGGDVEEVMAPCRPIQRVGMTFSPAILRIVHLGGVTE